jgi:CAAX prenyl protease-like protein
MSLKSPDPLPVMPDDVGGRKGIWAWSEKAPADVAYFLPMAVFLFFTWIGSQGHWLFPVSYVVKTLLTGALLLLFWRRYTTVRWTHLGLGFLVGVVGLVQWVGMEKFLLHVWPHYPRLGADIFDPTVQIQAALPRYLFLAVRLLGPVLVVPVMEELFWRDFLWRSIEAPNDFKMVEVGTWDRNAVVLVTLLFASVHIQWMTAIVWGLMIVWLLLRTKSLGACIVAHATTNLLLGVYVLASKDWMFW